MRKFLKEFFYVPKHGKIHEKVMLTRVATTVAIVIMCLASMSFTAYAYFSYNVTSASNIIKAANFKTQIQIEITDEDGNTVADSQITPITSDHKKFKIEGLEVDKLYTVTISQIKDETAAKTGFIVVTAKDCPDTYHTQQLGNDESVEGGRTEKIIFDLSVTADTTVFFLSHWGTSSYYDDYKDNGDGGKLYITNDNIGENAVKMVIDAPISSVSDSENEEKEATSDETSTTTQSSTPEATETSEPTTTTEPTTTQPPESTQASSDEITEQSKPSEEESETPTEVCN